MKNSDWDYKKRDVEDHIIIILIRSKSYWEDMKCNRSLDMLHKRLTEEFLTSQHDEYSSISCRQSLRVSWDKSNETSQL